MGEPLKNKRQSHCHRIDKTDRHDIHDDKDIKSAVEWLKEENLKLNKQFGEDKLTFTQWLVKRDELINKAFEDVTKTLVANYYCEICKNKATHFVDEQALCEVCAKEIMKI